MIRPIIIRRRRIIVDVDTQKDLFVAKGICCVRNHRRVLANIRRVMAWARLNNIRQISTALVRSQNGRCCIEGTAGQGKIRYTLRHLHTTFPADGNTDLPKDIFTRCKQVILNKRCEDPFSEPRADRLLTELRADEFIIIGGFAESAVLATALGLLQRGKNVVVLTDAVGSQNKEQAEIAFRKIVAKGGRLAETKSLAGSSCLRQVGICTCDRCSGKLRKVSLTA